MRRIRETGWQRMLGVGLAVALMAGLAARPGRSRCFASCPRRISRSSTPCGRPTTSRQPRLHDLRRAVRAEREARVQAPDGGHATRRARTGSSGGSSCGTASSSATGARSRPRTPWRPSSAGETASRWQDAAPVHQGGGGHRAAHLRDPAGQAVRPGPGGAGHARRTRSSSTARRRPRLRPTSRSPRPSAPGPS